MGTERVHLTVEITWCIHMTTNSMLQKDTHTRTHAGLWNISDFGLRPGSLPALSQRLHSSLVSRGV